MHNSFIPHVFQSVTGASFAVFGALGVVLTRNE